MSLLSPNYYDRNDRELYEELFYRNNGERELTEIEKNFVKAMYHLEEFACGLDGA